MTNSIQNCDRRSDDRETHRQTDASDLMICTMLCYSNGTDNNGTAWCSAMQLFREIVCWTLLVTFDVLSASELSMYVLSSFDIVLWNPGDSDEKNHHDANHARPNNPARDNHNLHVHCTSCSQTTKLLCRDRDVPRFYFIISTADNCGIWPQQIELNCWKNIILGRSRIDSRQSIILPEAETTNFYN